MMKKLMLISVLALGLVQVAVAGKKTADRKVAQFGSLKGTVQYEPPTSICNDGKCAPGNYAGTVHIFGDAAKSLYDKMTVKADSDSGEKVGKHILCTSGEIYDCTIQINDIREGTITANDGYVPTAAASK